MITKLSNFKHRKIVFNIKGDAIFLIKLIKLIKHEVNIKGNYYIVYLLNKDIERVQLLLNNIQMIALIGNVFQLG